jgi:hypothetical protein
MTLIISINQTDYPARPIPSTALVFLQANTEKDGDGINA